jgi:FAD:protein FMN transferase
MAPLLATEVMGCSLETDAAAAEQPGLLAHFAALEDRFSRFLPGSELSLVNAQDGVCVLSTEFLRVLGIALLAAEVSDGLVDPTLGNALDAAGYDRDFADLPADTPEPAGTPQASAIARLSLEGRLLRLPDGVSLDLNGVVKALAVDEGLALCPSASFLACGGDVAVRSETEVALPGGGAVRLQRGALATSGSTKRRWLRDGQLQHHLIDPLSGAPAATPWQAVSVCGASTLDADIAAKAAFLLGTNGTAWLDARGLPGRFLAHDGSVVENACWQTQVAPAQVAA